MGSQAGPAGAPGRAAGRQAKRLIARTMSGTGGGAARCVAGTAVGRDITRPAARYVQAGPAGCDARRGGCGQARWARWGSRLSLHETSVRHCGLW